MSKLSIPAIHDDDLEKLLKQYGLFEKVKNGEIHCPICDTIISWENIYGLYFRDNQPHLVCDSPECIDKLNNQE